MTQRRTVAVIGATGAVGQDLRRLLATRDFPCDEVVFAATARSAGKTLPFRGREVVVRDIEDADVFEGVDVALFSAGATRSREWAPRFVDAGAVVVVLGGGMVTTVDVVLAGATVVLVVVAASDVVVVVAAAGAVVVVVLAGGTVVVVTGAIGTGSVVVVGAAVAGGVVVGGTARLVKVTSVKPAPMRTTTVPPVRFGLPTSRALGTTPIVSTWIERGVCSDTATSVATGKEPAITQ